MNIRHAKPEELPRLMEIYARARAFMAQTGNPRQWGNRNWPPEWLIRRDIEQGRCYVCTQDNRIIGVFFFDQGKQIEPTYAHIQDGAWLGPEHYGVIHRIAADGSVKGTGEFCIRWALEQCGSLRIDTHGDNRVMQGLLNKLGFHRSGVIFVAEDNDPRLAFEKNLG